MEFYTHLKDLIKDYRKTFGLSQKDLAASLDTDVRTVIRWEKGEAVMNPDRIKEFSERLFIPYQVLVNLNFPTPLPVYYSIQARTYALDAGTTQITYVDWLKQRVELGKVKIKPIETEKELKFIRRVLNLRGKQDFVNNSVILEAVKVLPELNVILLNEFGECGGNLVFFPLKYEVYMKLKKGKMKEKDIQKADFRDKDDKDGKTVFYFYSLYAEKFSNVFHLMNLVFEFFKKQNNDHLVAGKACIPSRMEFLKNIGLNKVTNAVVRGKISKEVMMEGSLYSFLNT